MTNNTTSNDGGDAFAAFFDEGEQNKSITVHEDGTITTSGGLNLHEAINLLQRAMSGLEDYSRLRMLPSVILKSEYERTEESEYMPPVGYDPFGNPVTLDFLTPDMVNDGNLPPESELPSLDSLPPDTYKRIESQVLLLWGGMTDQIKDTLRVIAWTHGLDNLPSKLDELLRQKFSRGNDIPF